MAVDFAHALARELELNVEVAATYSARVWIGDAPTQATTPYLVIVMTGGSGHERAIDGTVLTLARLEGEIRCVHRTDTPEQVIVGADAVRRAIDGHNQTQDGDLGSAPNTCDVLLLQCRAPQMSREGPSDGSDQRIYTRTIPIDVWLNEPV